MIFFKTLKAEKEKRKNINQKIVSRSIRSSCSAHLISVCTTVHTLFSASVLLFRLYIHNVSTPRIKICFSVFLVFYSQAKKWTE